VLRNFLSVIKMGLKRKITKDEHAALSDGLKEHYKESGDAFVLDLEKDDAFEHVKTEKQKAIERAEAAEARAQQLQREKEEADAERERERAKKSGDVTALENSYNQKLTETKSQYEARIQKMQDHIQREKVDNVALAIAQEISTAPRLILPHIKARLKADFDADTPVTRVLDATGQLSAMTLDELKREFIDNADFAGIIVGSKASGSGAHGGGNGGAGKKTLKDMSESERRDWYARDPAGFNRAVQAARETV